MMNLLKVIAGAIVLLMIYLIFPTEDVKVTSINDMYYNISISSKSFLKSKDETFLEDYEKVVYEQEDAWMFPITGNGQYGKSSIAIRHGVGYTEAYGGYHNGVDMGELTKKHDKNTKSSTVLSSTTGTVITSGFSNSAGNWVRVQTDDGYIISYMHMIDKPLVNVGDSVSPGTELGYMGSTGDSTGKHLHFQVEIPANDGGGRMIYNPFTMTKIDKNNEGSAYSGSKMSYYFDEDLAKIKIPSTDNYTAQNKRFPVLAEEDIVPNPTNGYVPEIEIFTGNYFD